jgi:hypothetical protein
MTTKIKKFAALFLFAGFGLVASEAQAQTTDYPLKQQGNGAYLQKDVTNFCIPNSLLNLQGIDPNGCLQMTRVKFTLTPSGNSQAVWRGTVPEGSRPAQRTTFNSTLPEIVEGPTQGFMYNTVAVTEPNGNVTLTLTSKANGKGNDPKGKGKK